MYITRRITPNIHLVKSLDFDRDFGPSAPGYQLSPRLSVYATPLSYNHVIHQSLAILN